MSDYFKKELDNIFEVAIPDEQILIMNDNEYTLKLKITFENGKYILIKPPSYNKYTEFVKDFLVLLQLLLLLNPEAKLLDSEEIKDNNDNVNSLLGGLIEGYIRVVTSKRFIKQFNYILKKYFTFQGHISEPKINRIFGLLYIKSDSESMSFREFKKALKVGIIPISRIILILSIMYNISDFIKKNVKFLLVQMGITQDSQKLSKPGLKSSEAQKPISIGTVISQSRSTLDDLAKEMTMKKND